MVSVILPSLLWMLDWGMDRITGLLGLTGFDEARESHEWTRMIPSTSIHSYIHPVDLKSIL
jgi:hypothetical protein